MTTLKDFNALLKIHRTVDRDYKILIRKKFWKSLDLVNEKSTHIILEFLKLWGILSIPDPNNPENYKKIKPMEKGLTNALKGQKENFDKLRNDKLIDFEFNNTEKVETIKEIFNNIKVKYIGSTAISKIMHLALPELFVMWDEAIKDKYLKKKRISGTSENYVKFLKIMQKIARDMLKQFIKKGSKNMSLVEAKKKFEEEYSEKSFKFNLTKLIDEYNWQSIKRGKYIKRWNEIEKMNI